MNASNEELFNDPDNSEAVTRRAASDNASGLKGLVLGRVL